MRHDALMEKFLCAKKNHGWSVVRGPVIPLRGGPRWVVGASGVAGNTDPDDVHVSKCGKHDTPAVRDWCLSNWPSLIHRGQCRSGPSHSTYVIQ